MSKFRAVLVGKAISISEVGTDGNVLRHVATIPPEYVPQFFDDIRAIREQMRPIGIFGHPVVFDDQLTDGRVEFWSKGD